MFNFSEATNSKPRLEGNMLPVINMTFLLLLFFIVVGNFSEFQNQDIFPPHSQSKISLPLEEMELLLTSNGTIMWENKEISIAAWAEALRKKGLEVPRKVRLRASGDIRAAVFLPVFEDLKAAQIRQIGLVTVNFAVQSGR